MKLLLLVATGLIGAALLSVAVAQTAAKPGPKTAAEGIAEYRKMLEDGNPAELFEAKGEDLWKTPRGPAKATLQRCDLGLGPGVVKGAWVQLPRWFADTGRVQDLESRLLTCMATIQGFNATEIYTEEYTLSLHDALPICRLARGSWHRRNPSARRGRKMPACPVGRTAAPRHGPAATPFSGHAIRPRSRPPALPAWPARPCRTGSRRSRRR